MPPGTNESNVPIPVFNLTAGATVDEGNNWINISWGPLSLVSPTTETNPATETLLADYTLAAGSPAIGYITNANSSTTYAVAPTNDFFENPRKTNNSVDVGAVEFSGTVANTAILSVTGGPVNFGNVVTGTTSATQTLTLSNTGTGRGYRYRGCGRHYLDSNYAQSVCSSGRYLRYNLGGRRYLHDHRDVLADNRWCQDGNCDHHSERYGQRFTGGSQRYRRSGHGKLRL